MCRIQDKVEIRKKDSSSWIVISFNFAQRVHRINSQVRLLRILYQVKLFKWNNHPIGLNQIYIIKSKENQFLTNRSFDNFDA